MASLGTPVFPGTQVEKPCRMKRGIYELNRNELGDVTSFRSIIGAANETDDDDLMNKFQVSIDRISQPVFSGVFRGKPAGVPRKATRTTLKFSQFTNIYRFRA